MTELPSQHGLQIMILETKRIFHKLSMAEQFAADTVGFRTAQGEEYLHTWPISMPAFLL